MSKNEKSKIKTERSNKLINVFKNIKHYRKYFNDIEDPVILGNPIEYIKTLPILTRGILQEEYNMQHLYLLHEKQPFLFFE